jgi:threonine/homoserine/homoserine lactone efflux protein
LFRNFIKGLLTNLLNPKIVLFYLSIFPQFVSKEAVLSESIILGSIQAIVVSLWFTVIILLAESFKKFFVNVRNARRLNFLSGGIFMLFSVKLATTEL